MTVSLRPYKKNGKDGWEVDIRLEWPDGTTFRERRKSPVSAKDASLRWGRQREAELIRRGPEAKQASVQEPPPEKPKVEEPPPALAEVPKVPTLRDFVSRFIDLYARANGQSLREVENKESILKLHLLPHLGDRRLDQIKTSDIQNLKKIYREGYTTSEGKKVPPTTNQKTLNNRLTVLGKLLHVAHEWGELPCPPPRVEVKAIKDNLKIEFFEPGPLENLITGAKSVRPEVLVLVLLGADAGLRRGEICGLEWGDIDFGRSQILVQRQVHKGKPCPPKGGKNRYVPMTARLTAALQAIRHLRGPRVLYHRGRDTKFREATPKVLRMWMREAERAASLPVRGALHILRHTFCSRLAAQNAPVLTIKELAGHSDLKTTLRYMHLAQGAKHEAIALLDGPTPAKAREA
jgi:integrase